MPAKIRPISLTVRYLNPATARVDTALVSAFCRSCGDYRGKPKITKIDDPHGEPVLVHRWINKCGHIDDDDSIHMEVESQCFADGCVVMASSAVYFPYCGENCVVQAGLNIVGDLRACSATLEGISAVLATMLDMIDHPELDVPGVMDSAVELWRSNCTNTIDAITRAQMTLIEAIAHGMNGYTMEGAARYG